MNNPHTNFYAVTTRAAILTAIGEVQTSLGDLGLGKAQHTLAATLRHLLREPDFADSLPFVVERLRNGNDLACAHADRLEDLVRGAHDSSATALPPADEQQQAAVPTAEGVDVDAVEPVIDQPTQRCRSSEPEIVTTVKAPAVPPSREMVGQELAGRSAPRDLGVSVLPAPLVHEGAAAPTKVADAANESTSATPITPPGAGTAQESVPMTMLRIDQVTISPDFSELLSKDPRVSKQLRESIERDGFDTATPIVAWDNGGRFELVDGHHRLEAANAAGAVVVPAVVKEFADRRAAQLYALRSQAHRRNLSDSDLIRLLVVVDDLKQQGGDRRSDRARSTFADAKLETSARKTADLLGVSEAKVNRARRVSKDPKVAARVRNGALSINQAESIIREKHRPARAVDLPEAPGAPPAIAEPADSTRKRLQQLGKALTLLDEALLALEDADSEAREAVTLAAEVLRDRIANVQSNTVCDNSEVNNEAHV